MRQENLHGIVRRTVQRPSRIALVRVAADRIGHASHDQRRRSSPDEAMLVLEKGNAQPGDLLHPLAGAPVVFVVPGDEEDAVRRAKPGQRLDRVAEIFDIAVDQVAGDRDRIGVQPVGPIDQRLDEAALDCRSDVNVAPLHDAIALQLLRQITDVSSQAHHLWMPGLKQSDHGEQRSGDQRDKADRPRIHRLPKDE